MGKLVVLNVWTRKFMPVRNGQTRSIIRMPPLPVMFLHIPICYYDEIAGADPEGVVY